MRVVLEAISNQQSLADLWATAAAALGRAGKEKSSAFFGRKGDKWREIQPKSGSLRWVFPQEPIAKRGRGGVGSRAQPDSQPASCCGTDVWRGSIPSARPARTPVVLGTRRACGEGGSVVPRQREGSGLGNPWLIKPELMRYRHGRRAGSRDFYSCRALTLPGA